MTNLNSEEIKNDTTSTNESQENTQKQEAQIEREFTTFEQEQIKLGWDPNGKKSAEQWSADYPLFKKIAQQNDKLEKVERLLENMTKERQKAEEYGYKRAMDEFEARKQAAAAKNDVGEYNKAVSEQEQYAKEEVEKRQNHPAVKAFEDKYQDILNCKPDDFDALAALSDMQRVDVALGARNLPPEEHLALLDQYMQKTHKNLFNKQENDENKVLAIETNTRSSSMKAQQKRFTYDNLSKEQKEIADYLKKTLGKSHDDYIKDLVKFGDLK